MKLGQTSTAHPRRPRRVPAAGIAAFAGVAALVLAGCTAGTTEPEEVVAERYEEREVTDGTTTFMVVDNPGDGATLSYGADSAITLLEEEVDGSTYAFKDMNGNGELDVWEDWRVDPQERAADLARQLTVEQISGLMLFSNHERSPADGLTDGQRTYLSEDKLRNVLNAGGSDVTENVTWVNEMQAYVESIASVDEPYVPANFSSDPRSEAQSGSDYVPTGEGVSLWPSVLGLAATFSPETVEAFGRTVSEEYRALGISNALSPQIDLATEPRWLRVAGTLGENPELAAELASAYVRGFQGTYDEDGTYLGFGPGTVPTTIKHAPGDGSGEGGRESHLNVGKYAIPGEGLDDHVAVFEAATDSLAMMTAYSIMLGEDGEPVVGDEAVGVAYNTEMMRMIREDIGFDGAIVTDWAVMTGYTDENAFLGTAWGAEDLTPVERYFTVLRNGVDMFGGVNTAEHILEAYDMWQAEFEAGSVDVDADARWAESGARILAMYFAPGLFDAPYVDLDEARATVGSADRIEAGFDAQLDSVVMVKNDGVIAEASEGDWADATVYIPHTYDTGVESLFGPAVYTEGPSLSVEAAEQVFGTVLTDTVELDDEGNVLSAQAPDLSDVDLVLVGLRSPNNGMPFSGAGQDDETGEWYPFSLQWAPYTADGEHVRTESIGGDVLEDGSKENRSYFGNTSRISNEADIRAFERAMDAIEESGRDIPVITVVKANNPVVPAEFEAESNAVLVGFGVSDLATVTVAAGLHEPQGRLPIGFPVDMDAVEAQSEGVGEDMDTYVDAAGNDWAFGFGLGFSGPIGLP
ncbi:glycoside hydrolase family 3 N-terminal domain-containing protein [Cellulomonas bogoriensis]|uniref:beta-glucosidase n=1 Tax=Cellulomonas bogoriensis 69B4 = DSM 16987 TaxID=1386082 RepID=A0A0A0BZZ5_9CELL|nr:glycoside hydrolase family 3 N-terminal domain-containing protein [Cellulomonas bogoriensis]KGM13988.1 beta-glucosidase [Cellulomonas bogoriensis 69B4 = DSM 16987]